MRSGRNGRSAKSLTCGHCGATSFTRDEDNDLHCLMCSRPVAADPLLQPRPSESLARGKSMTVGLYARVGPGQDDQYLEDQLWVLYEYCLLRGWSSVDKYVDRATAGDLELRTAWRQLMDDVARHRLDTVIVFKLSVAFRSLQHMLDTLNAWKTAGVSFRSVREQLDTSTTVGRLQLGLLASLIEFEMDLIHERVAAGMDRLRKEGKNVGRPRVSDTGEFARRFARILPRVVDGEMSLNQAARQLGISRRSFTRYMKEAV